MLQLERKEANKREQRLKVQRAYTQFWLLIQLDKLVFGTEQSICTVLVVLSLSSACAVAIGCVLAGSLHELYCFLTEESRS